MKLYRNNDGVWVGTQAEAGNKNIIEVPVDKPSLLEWLNANVTITFADTPIETDGHCPKCRLNLHAAAEKAERELATVKADAIAKWLETAPTGKVADVFVALADRYQNASNSACEPAVHSEKSEGGD